VLALAAWLLVVTPTAAGSAAAPSDPSPSPVSVRASASKAEVTVGEAFGVEVNATGPAGTTFTFPGEAVTDTFELRTPRPDPRQSASPPPAPGTHRYEAAVYVLGEAEIPPIPVRYRLPDGTEGGASSEAIALKVVSLLPRDPQEQKLADVRGPLAVGIGPAFWIALAACLVLAAALVVWLVRRRREAELPPPAPVPELPADTEALRALEALLASGLLSRGEYRPFYIQLAAVAKRYLERRLGAPILEMTSAETLAFLRSHPRGGELLPVVRDLAEVADRIKFAKGHGLALEAERHLAAVRSLVPSLEAKLGPAVTDGGEGRAA
jgi:hypothetical protein